MTTLPADDSGTDFVVRSEERLQLDSEWVAFERVRVRRRIVTETVTVTVDVRREELVFEQAPIEDLPIQTSPLPYVAPIVMTLREEVPVVTLTTRPYEQVTVSVAQVTGQQEIAVDLDREEIELQTHDASGGRRRHL